VTHILANIKQLRKPSIEGFYSERNVHDHLKHLTVPELQEITANSALPFWVMTLNVLGDLNTATVIRSAHLLGAERVVVFGRRKIDNRGLVGAAHYTPVDKVWAVNDDLSINVNTFVQFCKDNQVLPVFIEQGGENCFLMDWCSTFAKYTQQRMKPMLVLGTEKDGIPQDILNCGIDLGGTIVSIPQKGVVRSHNLSMAFAIVTSQMVGQLGWY